MVTSYRFLEGGPIALHGLVPFLNTTGPSLSKVVFADFDRISRVNIIYIYKLSLSTQIYNELIDVFFPVECAWQPMFSFASRIVRSSSRS